MKIKDQVCSIELAKKLKELGIMEESLFYWSYGCVTENSQWLICQKDSDFFYQDYDKDNDIFHAYNVSELAEKLPNRIVINTDSPFNSFRLRIEKSFVVENEDLKIIYIANYRCDSTECEGENAWMERTLLEHNVNDENMSNCLAKLLIKLIEYKIINNKKKDK